MVLDKLALEGGFSGVVVVEVEVVVDSLDACLR